MNNTTLYTMTTEWNLVGKNALDRLSEVCGRIFGDRPLVVISDERIWEHEGKRLESCLSGKKDFRLFLLPAFPAPYADDALVAAVRAAIGEKAPIAFGGGTINDVVKLASFGLGRPYVCVPTAPSVDGFAAYGAAITVGGFKTTVDCPAPKAIIADEGILRRAPDELCASGFGDLVAKLTAGVDWMAADAGGIEPIQEEIWDMVQPQAAEILKKAKSVHRREAAAIGDLYRGLVATGLAMQRYHDSRPASGAEHLLSHVWEMEHLSVDGVPVSHGFKVAIGTIAVTKFQRALFSLSKEEIEAAGLAADATNGTVAGGELLERRLAMARQLLGGSPILDKTLEAVQAKTPRGAALAARRAAFISSWDSLRQHTLARLPDSAALIARLGEAGCPTKLSDIGLSREDLLRGFKVASLIRKRYTTLDLAAEFGLLEKLAETASDWDH